MKLSLGKFCGYILLTAITLGSLSKCGNEAPATNTTAQSITQPSEEPTYDPPDDSELKTSCDRPFRSRYEEVIATGSIKRPSLVANSTEALRQADIAKAKGNSAEIAMRLFQAIVITEDKSGQDAALGLYNTISKELNYHSSLEVMLPTPNTPCV